MSWHLRVRFSSNCDAFQRINFEIFAGDLAASHEDQRHVSSYSSQSYKFEYVSSSLFFFFIHDY